MNDYELFMKKINEMVDPTLGDGFKRLRKPKFQDEYFDYSYERKRRYKKADENGNEGSCYGHFE